MIQSAYRRYEDRTTCDDPVCSVRCLMLTCSLYNESIINWYSNRIQMKTTRSLHLCVEKLLYKAKYATT